jgi:hypothetical protein
MSGSEAHKLMGNTTPNESRSDWDLPSGIFPHLIERVILARQQKWSEKEGFLLNCLRVDHNVIFCMHVKKMVCAAINLEYFLLK